MLKKVAYSLYAHRSNVSELLCVLNLEEKQLLYNVINFAKKLGLNYCIIKFNRQAYTVSLIQCDTWDTLNEPIVGDSYCFKNDLFFKVLKGGTKVYHNKWQFVADDYKGFDIQTAKDRSILWNKIPDIKSHKSRIGNKDYWYKLLSDNHISI